MVICAPIGLENVCAYRPLRALAKQLVASGRPTLRFDLPAVGDSSGHETDEGLVEASVKAIEQAVSELRERTGVRTVALVGVRLGATLAAAAAARGGGVDELVLWAPLQNGRAYLREMRAFHAVAEREFVRSRALVDPLPEGAVEASGFLIAPSTAHDLATLDLSTLIFAEPPPSRILSAERVGTRAEGDPVIANLRAQGIEVDLQELDDLDEVVAKSLNGAIPKQAFDAIDAWLKIGSPSPPSRPSPPSPDRPASTRRTALQLEVAGSVVTEEAVCLQAEQPWFSVVTMSSGAELGRTWVVFVNTGGARRIGPSRLWVEFARRWASLGVPSMRLDVRGAGDSDGSFSATLPSIYDSGTVEDTRAALAYLRERHGAERFVLIGLCSGAYTALYAANSEPEVVGVGLVNLETLSWTPHDQQERERFVRLSPFQRGRWLRLLGGEVSVGTVLRAATRTVGVSTRWLTARVRSRVGSADLPPDDRSLLEFVDRPLDRGCRLSFVFSKGSEGLDYLEWKFGPSLGDIPTRAGVDFHILAGPDHTFRPLSSHEPLRHLLEEHLAACGLDLGGFPRT